MGKHQDVFFSSFFRKRLTIHDDYKGFHAIRLKCNDDTCFTAFLQLTWEQSVEVTAHPH